MWEEEMGSQPEMGKELGVLGILADFVNMYDLQVSVTLVVQGMLVSGTLIGIKAYVTELGRLLEHESPPLPGDAGSEIRQALTDYAERQAASLTAHAPLESEAENAPTAVQTLYLKHAQLLHNGDTVHLPLWACRLRAVSGFSLTHGSLSAT